MKEIVRRDAAPGLAPRQKSYRAAHPDEFTLPANELAAYDMGKKGGEFFKDSFDKLTPGQQKALEKGLREFEKRQEEAVDSFMETDLFQHIMGL
jgi:hypothetical protein